MKLESKFNEGDAVYFIHDNKVHKRSIREIIFPKVVGSTPIVSLAKSSFPIKTPDSIKYSFYEGIIDGPPFTEKLIGFKQLVERTEESLFKTQQELIDSL